MARIRITLERSEWVGWNGRAVPAKSIVREFDDEGTASSWFVNDSYFTEAYTVLAKWERIDDESVKPEPTIAVGAQVQDERHRAGTVVRLWNEGTEDASADVDMGSYFGTCVNVPLDRLEVVD